MKFRGKDNRALHWFALKGLTMREGAFLIGNNLDCTVKESIVDSSGRFIVIQVLLRGEPALLVEFYSPNRDNELVTFHRSLLQNIVKNNLNEIESTVVGGD